MILNVAENMMLTFMICHMVGVSSACTNPILYGFLNHNFVKEFNRILPFTSKMFKSGKKLDQLHLLTSSLQPYVNREPSNNQIAPADK